MSKAELGTKRICGNCGAKFYDLLKSEIVCPKCETVFVQPPPTPVRPRRTAAYVPSRDAAKARVPEDADSGDVAPSGADEAVDRPDGDSVGAEDERAAEGRIDEVGLILPDQHDDEDVGDILGTDGQKDERG